MPGRRNTKRKRVSNVVSSDESESEAAPTPLRQTPDETHSDSDAAATNDSSNAGNTSRASSLKQSKSKKVFVQTSFVWKLFEVDKENPLFAICQVCKKSYKRGTNAHSMGTSTLHKHLKNQHQQMWKEASGEAQEEAKATKPNADKSGTGVGKNSNTYEI